MRAELKKWGAAEFGSLFTFNHGFGSSLCIRWNPITQGRSFLTKSGEKTNLMMKTRVWFQAATFRHSSAHLLQDSAHLLQWSYLCSSHCSEHQSQISAQSLQYSFTYLLLLVMAWAHSKQISRHSRQHEGQSLWLSTPIIFCKQFSQSIAQSRHALMHSS